MRKCYEDDEFKHDASSLVPLAFEAQGKKILIYYNWQNITWIKASNLKYF